MNGRWRINLWLLLQVIVGLTFFGIDTYVFDIINFFLEGDISHISSVIAGLYVFTSFWIAKMIVFHGDHSNAEWPVYVSHNVTRLGLIGTVVGMIFAVYGLDGFDLTNHDEASEALSNLIAGVGTAMLTTLSGLVAAILLEAQLVIWNKTMLDVSEDEETPFD